MVARLNESEDLLEAALAAISQADGLLRAEALERVAAPVYVTDAEGRVTHYNRACVAFAGRVPEPGADRWCVTWKLFTTEGEPLAHDACPMAVAIRERRKVRGIEALAERPDGTRVRFLPYPTPIYDAGGALAGAVNLVVDVTDIRRADDLRAEAARCRRLASPALDRQTRDALTRLASECDDEAERLSRTH